MRELIKTEYASYKGIYTRKFFWYHCDECGKPTSRCTRAYDYTTVFCDDCREARRKRRNIDKHLEQRSANPRPQRIGMPPMVRSKVKATDPEFVPAKCCNCDKEFIRTGEWAYSYTVGNRGKNWCCTYKCLQEYRRKWELPRKELEYEA